MNIEFDSYKQKLNDIKPALAGLAAASVAMESVHTINPAMSATELKTRMKI